MVKLPSTIIQHICIYIYIYEYDNTYNIKFDKDLLHMKMHCFIYKCSG